MIWVMVNLQALGLIFIFPGQIFIIVGCRHENPVIHYGASLSAATSPACSYIPIHIDQFCINIALSPLSPDHPQSEHHHKHRKNCECRPSHYLIVNLNLNLDLNRCLCSHCSYCSHCSLCSHWSHCFFFLGSSKSFIQKPIHWNLNVAIVVMVVLVKGVPKNVP